MRTAQLREMLSRVLNVLAEDARPFLSLLEQLSNTQDMLDQITARLISGNDAERNATSNEIRNGYAQVAKSLRGHKLREVFTAANVLRAAIEEHAVANGESSYTLLSEIGEFEQKLDDYATSHAIEASPLLLRMASRLNVTLGTYKLALQVSLAALQTGIARPGNGEELMQIVLYEDHSLSQVIEKLQALHDLCALLEDVLGLAGQEVSYRLARIETGSLTLEVIAQRIGIKALKELVIGIGAYVYRTYTREGQLKYGVPLAADAARQVLKVRNELAKSGVDVSKMDKALSAHGQLLALKVQQLCGFQAEMRVDDEVLYPDQPAIGFALHTAETAAPALPPPTAKNHPGEPHNS